MGTGVRRGRDVMGNGGSSEFLSVRMSNYQCTGRGRAELCTCVSIDMRRA